MAGYSLLSKYDRVFNPDTDHLLSSLLYWLCFQHQNLDSNRGLWPFQQYFIKVR